MNIGYKNALLNITKLLLFIQWSIAVMMNWSLNVSLPIFGYELCLYSGMLTITIRAEFPLHLIGLDGQNFKSYENMDPILKLYTIYHFFCLTSFTH